MAKDFSEIYELIEKADKAGDEKSVQELFAYIDAESAKNETYDPRDKSSGLIPAGAGAAAAAVAKPLIESGKTAVQQGRAPQGGALSRGPITGELPPGHTPYNPKGRSVEGSLENWRKYNEAQLEAAKKVRQESALQKKYPGFTRAGAETGGASLAKNAAPIERIAAKMLPGGLSDVANFAKGVADYKLPFIGSVGSLAGRSLAGAGAGLQAQEAYNRGVEGDDVGKYIGYVGAAGTGASALPFPPPVRAVGAGVGLSAEAINAYRKALLEGRIKHGAPENYENTDAIGNMYAGGGPVQHFAFGGSTSPFVNADQPQAFSDTTTSNSLVPAAAEPVQAFNGQMPGAGGVMPTIRQYTPQRPQQTVAPSRPQNGGLPAYMQNNQAYEAQRQSRSPYTAFPPANQLLPQGRVTPRLSVPTIGSNMPAPQGMPNQNDPRYAHQTEIIPQPAQKPFFGFGDDVFELPQTPVQEPTVNTYIPGGPEDESNFYRLDKNNPANQQPVQKPFFGFGNDVFELPPQAPQPPIQKALSRQPAPAPVKARKAIFPTRTKAPVISPLAAMQMARKKR